jgi:hypothetical protein
VIKRISLFLLSISLYLSGHFALAARYEPLINFFFVTSWWSYIILIDTYLSARSGKYFFLNQNLPAMVAISCGFWCFFELANLHLDNWFYVNIPYNAAMRYAGYFFAYGSVIPAICLTTIAVEPLFPAFKTGPLVIRNYSTRAITTGFILFALAMLLPRFLFGLMWVFGIFVIDGINYRARYRSFMADLEKGNPGRLLAVLAAGFICGIIWEGWNSLSPVRWIYTVPFLENVKIFEMPVVGYIGFPVFAVETIAFFDLLQGLWRTRYARVVTVCVSLLLSGISFVLIDRYTVFSYTTPVENMSFLTVQSKERLQTSGAKTNLSIDPEKITTAEAASMQLINLKGLGHENYLKLQKHGIVNIKDFKAISDRELSRILGEQNLRRIHVYQEAAKGY